MEHKTVLASTDQQGQPLLTSGWHYLDFRDGHHDANYVEWKYFNFKQGDLAGYIVYWIIDPERRTKFGGARVLARVFQKQKFSGSIKEVELDAVQFDGITAGVDMGGSRIVERDPHHYMIYGAVDGLTWQLEYQQQVPSIEAFQDVPCGVLRWEQADWLVKMPRATVTGTITTADGPVAIDAVGYSDTNWGEFLPFFSKYEWGQFSDERITFIFGLLYRLGRVQHTYFYLIIDHEIVRLENPQCTVRHTEWGPNGPENIRVPYTTTFVITDRQYSIRFTSHLVASDLMGLRLSPLLPKPSITEQMVSYRGVIERKGRAIYSFEGLGFQEWSVKTYKKTPITF